jgi:hypothetical protein
MGKRVKGFSTRPYENKDIRKRKQVIATAAESGKLFEQAGIDPCWRWLLGAPATK